MKLNRFILALTLTSLAGAHSAHASLADVPLEIIVIPAHQPL